MQIEQFLLAALQQVGDELSRVELRQKTRESLHRHRLGAEGRDFNPQPPQQRLNMLQQPRPDVPKLAPAAGSAVAAIPTAPATSEPANPHT